MAVVLPQWPLLSRRVVLPRVLWRRARRSSQLGAPGQLARSEARERPLTWSQLHFRMIAGNTNGMLQVAVYKRIKDGLVVLEALADVLDVDGEAQVVLKFDWQDRHFLAGIPSTPRTAAHRLRLLGTQKSGEARKIAPPRFVVNNRSHLHCSPGQAMTQFLGQIILAHFVSNVGPFF